MEFRSPSSSAVVTVLLGLGALVAAGVAVYEAYLDQLTTPPGIAASAVTLLLVVIVGRPAARPARSGSSTACCTSTRATATAAST